WLLRNGRCAAIVRRGIQGPSPWGNRCPIRTAIKERRVRCGQLDRFQRRKRPRGLRASIVEYVVQDSGGVEGRRSGPLESDYSQVCARRVRQSIRSDEVGPLRKNRHVSESETAQLELSPADPVLVLMFLRLGRLSFLLPGLHNLAS